MIRLEFRAKSALRFFDGVRVTYPPRLEVSLACGDCTRNHRVVTVRVDGATCQKDAHAFDASLDEHVVESVYGLSLATYAVSFAYAPFIDVKSNEASVRYPRWGRITFSVSCPSCRAVADYATQTNLHRPWLALCRCGQELYVESGQLPLFECGPRTTPPVTVRMRP